MPLTKEKKKKIIEDLKEKIDKQKSMVFVSIANLKAKELIDLRDKLKEKDCLLFVVKKTLLKIASQEKKLLINVKELEGELALVFGLGNEISAARIAYQFSLEHEKLKILGGIFKNEFIDKEKVIELAQISSGEELLAKLIGSISSPMSGFINALEGNIKGLIYILRQVKT